MSGKVSIIMPAYNEERYIGEAIESIRNQTYTNWELIVADDASIDNTPQMLDEYTRLDSRIKVVHMERNQGSSAALNIALANVSGDYICWLSADDRYCSGMLASSVEYLQNHPEKGAVFSRHEFIDENSLLKNAWDPYGEELPDKEPYRTVLLLGNAFNACTVLGRCEAFGKAGRFDSEHRYANDYQFMMRLLAYSDIGYMPIVNVQSRVHSGQVSNEGRNDFDAIAVFVQMMHDEMQRNALFSKVGIPLSREGLLVPFESRVRFYKRLNMPKEVEETLRQKERFVLSCDLLLEADKTLAELARLVNQGEYEEAKQYISKISNDLIVYMDKETWGILLASILDAEGAYEEEIKVLSDVLGVNDRNYEAHFMLGKVWSEKGEVCEALSSFAKSVKYSVNERDDHSFLRDYMKQFVMENL